MFFYIAKNNFVTEMVQVSPFFLSSGLEQWASLYQSALKIWYL